MKIIVVSDTHSNNEILTRIEKKHSDAALFIHCGDLEDDPIEYPNWYFVRGNNDYFGGFLKERIMLAGDHRIYVTHSHKCPYYARKEALLREALKRGCDIVLYGHTHCSDIYEKNGILFINPGSTWHSRNGKPPSYAILTLDGLSRKAEIVYEPEW
ncbi:MAG: metallophosphoesterase [Holdemanella sp.]|nr:metallophosphoesterase [Holdemanella sp.]